MTTTDTELDLDFLDGRPLPGTHILTHMAATFRRYVEGRRRMQSVRGLSERMLRDIGVDPESVRQGYPRIAPNTEWLPDRRSLRQ
jgi:uncharacterized protein YjiS (DUF1127 family)